MEIKLQVEDNMKATPLGEGRGRKQCFHPTSDPLEAFPAGARFKPPHAFSGHPTPVSVSF